MNLWAMQHSNIAIFIPHLGCPNMCSFCNQRTISGEAKAPTIAEVKEILNKASDEVKDKKNAEIAFFGGSFTAINREYMLSLLETASGYVGENGFSGIRISTRPDAVDNEILSVLKRFGVTSIELGAQSMKDEVLSLNSRGHSADDVRNASKLIKSHGFSLGLQMMVGLYGDNAEGAYYTAKEIIKLSPETVRIYPTVIIKGTRLGELYQQGRYIPMDFDEAVEACSKLLLMFIENDINVIKLGLHSSKDVEEDMLGGIYHPSFKELCESRIYLKKAREMLKATEKTEEITLFVSPSAISKMIGNKRENIIILEREFNCRIKVKPDNAVALYEIKL